MRYCAENPDTDAELSALARQAGEVARTIRANAEPTPTEIRAAE